MTNGTFTCRGCGKTFIQSWSNDEAIAEFYAANPRMAEADVPIMIICDDCYKSMQEWLATLTPEQIKAMEDETIDQAKRKG